MVSSRARRVKIIPPSPEQESDIDQIESDEVDELDDLSDEDMLGNDDDMDPSDTSGLLDDNEELEDDLGEELDEDEDEEVIQPPTKSRSKRKKSQATASDDEEFDSDMEILRNQPMTKRQRAKHNKEEPEEYLELPMETGKKRQFTEEEAALRKSEVARRRKNQSIQRAEKDKQDTINRLLKKQASKSKKNIKDEGMAADQSPADRLQQIQDPHRLHYVQNLQGSTLTIPNKYTVNQVFFGHDDISNTNNISNAAKITTCQVEGCKGTRKYVAKKSGKVVCSYDHYKLVEL